MYLFGSHLIKKYFNDFRVPNDIDWVTNDIYELKKSTKDVEYYFIPFSPDREMTSDEIYTVKVSHAIYDIHWKKTMSDIRFLQIKGCKVIPDLLNKLREYWIGVHGEQKRTDFEVLPGKFFEDRVRRKFDHDDLHKMLNPNPTYFKMIDGGVTPNPEKFELLTQDEKKELMFEEAFVISIERFFNQPDKNGYNKAQQNLVTKLHPVWLADFVIENWSKWYWTPGISKFYKKYVTIKNK